MSYMKPYWFGSDVRYEEYLRRRDIALEGAKPVVVAISEQTKSLVNELQQVNRNLEQMQWGFAETNKQLRFMNETLSELLKAVKNPAQTAAFEQFDIARDAYRRGLYPDALAAISAAIDGNTASPGFKLEWRFHFFLGLLRLGNFDNNSPEVVDLAKAEAAFMEAARIARADNPDEAARALTAAGWAALVASGGTGEALERAHAHTLTARRTWEGIVDAGTVTSGRADTYAQLAKVAAVRVDDATLLEAFQTAIVLDYGKLVVAVEDGDLAARAATETAVSAALDRQTAWLRMETQRRLDVAGRMGITESAFKAVLELPLRLVADASPLEATTYVAEGVLPKSSGAYDALWDQIAHDACAEIVIEGCLTGEVDHVVKWRWCDIEALHEGNPRRYAWSNRNEIEFATSPLKNHEITFALRTNHWHQPPFWIEAAYSLAPAADTIVIREYGFARVGASLYHKESTSETTGGEAFFTYQIPGHTIWMFDYYNVSAERMVELLRATPDRLSIVCYPEVESHRVSDTDVYAVKYIGGPATEQLKASGVFLAKTQVTKLSSADLNARIPERKKACFPRSARVKTPAGWCSITAAPPSTLVMDSHGAPKTVLAVHRHTHGAVLHVEFQDGDSLYVTGNHLVCTPDGWAALETLNPGALVLGSGGGLRVVRCTSFHSREPVYNLIVEGGDYVVDGVVVHSFATLRVPRTVLWSVAPRMAPHVEAAVIAAFEQLEVWRDRTVHAFHRLVSSRTARLLS